jgi:hypothetical protein
MCKSPAESCVVNAKAGSDSEDEEVGVLMASLSVLQLLLLNAVAAPVRLGSAHACCFCSSWHSQFACRLWIDALQRL